jgi:Dyp-type peroxidase family
MPVTLKKPADEVDITSGEYDVLLRNLQANILWAHGRNFARHVFIRFTGDRARARAWIRGSAGQMVTTAKQQLEQIQAREKDKAFNGGLVTGFFLAAKGYAFLGLDTKRFEEVFQRGMKSQKTNVVEAIKGSSNKDPKPDTWEPEFQKEIHALLTVADAKEEVVKEAVKGVVASLAGIGEVLCVQEGTVLRRPIPGTNDFEPVEHFGYFDGISQPVFTKRDLDKERPENLNRKNWDPGAPLSLVLTDDPHTNEAEAYGSYLVYRKLAQNFDVFNARVIALAASLKIDPNLAGAMVIGRFKDGTPVISADKASPGTEVLNDFDYDGDKDGFRCPFHAHIRKVNPRGTTPLTSLESERKRRIVRRGIPYGPPMPGVVKDTEPNPRPDAPRGLLFMCYQQDIDAQFEFIQRTWVDSTIFPKGILLQSDTGDDPLIGQDADEAQRWPKRWGDPNGGRKAFNFESAVTLKGGEYFFAPSIPFIRSL